MQNEEAAMRHGLLTEALGKLNDRERRIFEARRLQDDPVTLEDLSQEFGVSRERIRQIEVRAFEKVQKAVKNAAAAPSGAQDPAFGRRARLNRAYWKMPFWRGGDQKICTAQMLSPRWITPVDTKA